MLLHSNCLHSLTKWNKDRHPINIIIKLPITAEKKQLSFIHLITTFWLHTDMLKLYVKMLIELKWNVNLWKYQIMQLLSMAKHAKPHEYSQIQISRMTPFTYNINLLHPLISSHPLRDYHSLSTWRYTKNSVLGLLALLSLCAKKGKQYTRRCTSWLQDIILRMREGNK